jgi:hypothetical protein
MEVFEFLLNNHRHLASQFAAIDISPEQAHGRCGGFVLAVGVIDQDLWKMLVDLP